MPVVQVRQFPLLGKETTVKHTDPFRSRNRIVFTESTHMMIRTFGCLAAIALVLTNASLGWAQQPQTLGGIEYQS